MDARRRCCRRAAFGFVVGMPIGTLILVITSLMGGGGALLFTDALLERVGGEACALLVQMLLSGVVGAVAMAGSVLFEIDRWGLVRSAVSHCVLYLATLLFVGTFLGWFEEVGDVCWVVVVTIALHAIITCALTRRYRGEVAQLNLLIRERRAQGS